MVGCSTKISVLDSYRAGRIQLDPHTASHPRNIEIRKCRCRRRIIPGSCWRSKPFGLVVLTFAGMAVFTRGLNVLIGDRTGMNREESGAFHTLIASTSSLTSKPLSCGQ